MIPYLNRILGALLVLAIGGIIVQSVRLDNAQDKYTEYRAEITKQLVEAYRANEQERSTAEKALAKAGEEYLRGKRDAEELEKVARDSLLADNASVRKHWREALRRAEQAEAGNANGGGDGEADAMRADIAEILRDAKQADARIVQLQNRIDTYLKQVNGEGWYDRESRLGESGGFPETFRSATPTLGTDTSSDGTRGILPTEVSTGASVSGTAQWYIAQAFGVRTEGEGVREGGRRHQ